MPPPIEPYKPGSVRRVKLHNFLTYQDVEFYPGPRLNVVVGPNGTGKSTLLCAICLGLGGQPTLLGRADDARLFIMHEKDKASIEIELVPHPSSSPHPQDTFGFGHTHTLRRVIDRNAGSSSERSKGAGASTFYINDRKTNYKTVKELVTTVYQIQIDNLCTFLPQDKVGSFSGFNPQQLLIETEKALLMKWYHAHQRLIVLEHEVSAATDTVQTIEDKLANLKADNAALEKEKALMEEREQLKIQMTLLHQKMAWLKFDDARQRAVELKTEKAIVKKALQEALSATAPLEQKHANVTSECERLHSKIQQMDKSIKECKKQHEKNLQKAETFQDGIETTLGNINSIDALQRRAERQVQTQNQKVLDLEAELANYPPKEEIVARREEATKELRTLKQQLDRAKRSLHSISSKQGDLQDKLSTMTTKLTRMNDDKARRKEKIFRQEPSMGQTFAWVDQNRKMFRRPVWGPIVCEVTMKSKDAAMYLEQHVANAVLKSYVVECEEDYNLLWREVRTKRNMIINIHTIPGGVLSSVRRSYSEQKMNMLKREHGVIGYLDEQFSAPDPVLETLRYTSGVASVLVGSEATQDSLDRKGLLDILAKREAHDKRPGLMSSCIFSCHNGKSFKYTSQISRYSGKSTLRVDEINPPRFLAPGIPPEQKEALARDLETVKLEMEDIQPELIRTKTEHDEIMAKGQEINQTVKDAKQVVMDFENMNRKVTTAKKKLEELKLSASKDNVAEKAELIKALKKSVTNCVNALEAAANKHESQMRATHTLAGAKMTEDGLAEKLRKILEALAERQNESADLEQQFNTLSQDFNDAKRVMKQLKQEADRIAPMKDAQGNDLPLKDQLERLPETLQDVEAAYDDASHKVNSISDNPEVLRQYEERKKQIAQVERQMEGLSYDENAKQNELNSEFTPWEAALCNTVKKVDKLFGEYMRELGCAGEVHLASALVEDEMNSGDKKRTYNFKNWGIEIRVKFREKASLQVLSAQVQSGGERSVSTIMYLMALQELMSAPFRCVDEINQGLDERNERLVFKRIVCNSTRTPSDEGVLNSHSGQYFLITPKLLPNLTDMEHEDVTILFIFNGPYNFRHYGDWNLESFLATKKRALKDTNENDDEEDRKQIVPKKRRG